MEEVNRIIYVGPSLYGCKLVRLRGEFFLGPAKQGDILRAVLNHKPTQVLLIDGVFHQSLSVWHKELVYALLEGVVCIGAASMGALRAAELHRYGMIGVGRIFERYLAGEEDDSLVAMTFDPDTYKPLVEAPVGQDQKRKDALEAIDYARSHATRPREPIKTSLDKSAISTSLQIVIDRILNDG
jgi:hypothetical protein